MKKILIFIVFISFTPCISIASQDVPFRLGFMVKNINGLGFCTEINISKLSYIQISAGLSINVIGASLGLGFWINKFMSFQLKGHYLNVGWFDPMAGWSETTKRAGLEPVLSLNLPSYRRFFVIEIGVIFNTYISGSKRYAKKPFSDKVLNAGILILAPFEE